MSDWPLVVVQSRMESTRLPGKALYPVAGTPLIAFLLLRLQQANLPGRIVLATTRRPADDLLEAWGKRLGVDVVRGETDDVLARYGRCLDRFSACGVVRVTGDNPCIDVDSLRRTGDAIAQGRADYVVAYEGLPFGTGSDGYTAEAFARAVAAAATPAHREHLNAVVLDAPGQFSTHVVPPDASVARPDVALTIDTRAQWEHVSRILETPVNAAPEIPLADVIARSDLLAPETGDQKSCS